MVNLVITDPFVNTCEFVLRNMEFLLSTGLVFVGLKVVYSLFVSTGWYSIEPVGCGVCNMYVGSGGGFVVVVPSFASWSAISWHVIPICALPFCIVM